MKIEFTKMQGAGNDYIYVNALKYPLPNPEELAVMWSCPHTGIGSDGLVLIGASDKADFSMRIFNADGSEARMCGNASRCIGPRVGPILEHHPLFPDRVNVEFAQVIKPGHIRMRVWERGSGITMACGTGACATAVASVYTHRCPKESDIMMDGGTLHIQWANERSHLFMTGPAVKVFDGVILIN